MERCGACNGEGWSLRWRGVELAVERGGACDGEVWSLQWRGVKLAVERGGACSGEGWSLQQRGVELVMERGGACSGEGWSLWWRGVECVMERGGMEIVGDGGDGRGCGWYTYSGGGWYKGISIFYVPQRLKALPYQGFSLTYML